MANISLLIEVKKFSNRNLTGQKQELKILSKLAEAKSNLIKKIRYLFLLDTSINSALAIIATGN